MDRFTGYVGTYHSSRSQGIYRFFLDAESGELTGANCVLDVPDSKYLAIRQDGLLASVVGRAGKAGLCVADLRQSSHPFQVEALTEGSAGCHAAFYQTYGYTANFHAGTVSFYRIADKTPVFQYTIPIAPGAGCHQVLFHADTLLVPCMELDEIRMFHIPDHTPCGTIPFPQGSGPRHAVLDETSQALYVAAQKDNSLYCFHICGNREFRLFQRVPLLVSPDSARDEAAAIRLSPDHRFLYISVRGADQIVVLERRNGKLQVIQRIPSGGEHPRDIALSPDGRWLLAANRFSGDLVSFPRDSATGRLGAACGHTIIHQGVSIVFDAQERKEHEK